MENEILDQGILKGFLQPVWLAVFLPLQALWRMAKAPSSRVVPSEIVRQSPDVRLKRELGESKFQLLSEVQRG